jgi:hypothetical protein
LKASIFLIIKLLYQINLIKFLRIKLGVSPFLVHGIFQGECPSTAFPHLFP